MISRNVLVFLFVHLVCCFASAQKTTIIADAEEMIKDTPTQTLTLRGKVNVIFQQQHLLCDEAVVYEETSTIVATGNVVLQNPRTTLRGEKIIFNYDTNRGKLFKGVVTSGQVLIESELIEKVGEDEYVADDAYYTACMTCPPSWGFTSSNLKAEIGGYAYISRPWLHLLQFPVLPLPYLVVPLNSRRQTGLLVPKPFTSRDGGMAIEQPFFWAIDRSHDATFSFINYEKRGQQVVGNYRYVISPTSSGELNTGFIHDRRVDLPEFKDRWFVDYGHLYDLPEDYTQRTKLALASDRKYSFDFFNQFLYNGYPALENSLSLTKSYENSLLTMEASYYLSQIEPGYSFKDDPSLHRLPEINYTVVDQKISEDLGVFFNMDVQYLNVTGQGLSFEHTRSGDACTTLNEAGDPVKSEVCYPTSLSDGEFVYGTPEGMDPVSNQAYGDLVRTGQRLDIMPRFHAPFWLGDYVDVSPSLAFRYTQYALGVESDPAQGFNAFPSRFYTQLDLSTKTYVSQVFDWSEKTKIKHSIIPEVNLRYIPEIHQSDHNFFGSSESLKYFRELEPIDDSDADWRNGGRGIQFDNNDRVIGKQILDFGIVNNIMSRSRNQDGILGHTNHQYQRNLLFRVSQTFDIAEAEKGAEGRPWQNLITHTQFNFGAISQSVQTVYYPYHNRTRWNANTRFSFWGNNYVQLSYMKNYTFPLEPPVNEDTRQEFLNFGTGLNFKYVYLFGRVNYDLNPNLSRGEKNFRSWMVATVITPPGSCWSINASLEKPLDSDNIMPRVSMEFTFGK